MWSQGRLSTPVSLLEAAAVLRRVSWWQVPAPSEQYVLAPTRAEARDADEHR
jgi:hypothetical protein